MIFRFPRLRSPRRCIMSHREYNARLNHEARLRDLDLADQRLRAAQRWRDDCAAMVRATAQELANASS